MPHFTALTLALLAGVLLDRLLGEPRRLHPLVGFGRWAGALETRLNRGAHPVVAGLLAWLLAVMPFVFLTWALGVRGGLWAWCVDVLALTLCVGARCLGEHARAVARPLSAGDLPGAREKLGRMVSRDTATLSETEVAAATTESVLENGNDAIFGALFWFLVGGAPAVVLFRLANTLDAMWGYRTPRFERFGRIAARADDLLGFIPARLTAASYAVLGETRRAWHCWRTQAPVWKSPNAGPVMAAGAGALGVRLGGPAPYHGHLQHRPVLGDGACADAGTPSQAIDLVDRATTLWTVTSLTLGLLVWGVSHA